MASSASGPRRFVLVVEDDDAIRTLIVATLSDEGYEVLAVDDGADALELLRTTAVGLILLDIVLPTMNGHDFVASYTSSQPQPAPILFLTAAAVGETPRGVVGHLQKPFSIEALVDAVNMHVAPASG